MPVHVTECLDRRVPAKPRSLRFQIGPLFVRHDSGNKARKVRAVRHGATLGFMVNGESPWHQI